MQVETQSLAVGLDHGTGALAAESRDRNEMRAPNRPGGGPHPVEELSEPHRSHRAWPARARRAGRCARQGQQWRFSSYSIGISSMDHPKRQKSFAPSSKRGRAEPRAALLRGHAPAWAADARTVADRAAPRPCREKGRRCLGRAPARHRRTCASRRRRGALGLSSRVPGAGALIDEALAVPGFHAWSLWQPERGMFFTSFLWVREGGNVVFDRLPLSDDERAVDALGGVTTILLTNRDHERAAAATRERFGARVLRASAKPSFSNCASTERSAVRRCRVSSQSRSTVRRRPAKSRS